MALRQVRALVAGSDEFRATETGMAQGASTYPAALQRQISLSVFGCLGIDRYPSPPLLIALLIQQCCPRQ